MSCQSCKASLAHLAQSADFRRVAKANPSLRLVGCDKCGCGSSKDHGADAGAGPAPQPGVWTPPQDWGFNSIANAAPTGYDNVSVFVSSQPDGSFVWNAGTSSQNVNGTLPAGSTTDQAVGAAIAGLQSLKLAVPPGLSLGTPGTPLAAVSTYTQIPQAASNAGFNATHPGYLGPTAPNAMRLVEWALVAGVVLVIGIAIFHRPKPRAKREE